MLRKIQTNGNNARPWEAVIATHSRILDPGDSSSHFTSISWFFSNLKLKVCIRQASMCRSFRTSRVFFSSFFFFPYLGWMDLRARERGAIVFTPRPPTVIHQESGVYSSNKEATGAGWRNWQRLCAGWWWERHRGWRIWYNKNTKKERWKQKQKK